VLPGHRVRQAEEQLAAGPAWSGEDLVFCNELGGPLQPDQFTRAFGRAVARADVR